MSKTTPNVKREAAGASEAEAGASAWLQPQKPLPGSEYSNGLSWRATCIAFVIVPLFIWTASWKVNEGILAFKKTAYALGLVSTHTNNTKNFLINFTNVSAASMPLLRGPSQNASQYSRIQESKKVRVSQSPLKATASNNLRGITPNTVNFVTDYVEAQPSARCLGKDYPHPFDAGAYSYLNDATVVCNGKDFTKLTLNNENRVELDMTECPSQPTWGLSVKQSDNTVWTKTVVLPRSGTPGIDFVFSKCRDVFTSFTGGRKTYSNLKMQPYKLPNSVLSKHSMAKPNVMVLLLDSLSWKRMELFLPKSYKFLKDLSNAYAFKFTSTVGYNTRPNLKAILGNGDVFQHATGMATSMFEDYSPDNALAKMYPFQHYKISGKNILKNYGNDIVNLYFKNKIPGCMHGEYWIQQHLRYIHSFWDIFSNKRKFHISKTYGCHLERSNNFVCGQNDGPLYEFLKDFLKKYTNTYLFLMSDHGFHWSKRGKFNEFVSGEYEHRNPIMYILSPKQIPLLLLNTKRFVSHYDVHNTLVYLLSGRPSSKGFNLITQELPLRRSCKDAGIPKKWCNCFTKKEGRTHLDSQQGEIGA